MGENNILVEEKLGNFVQQIYIFLIFTIGENFSPRDSLTIFFISHALCFFYNTAGLIFCFLVSLYILGLFSPVLLSKKFPVLSQKLNNSSLGVINSLQ